MAPIKDTNFPPLLPADLIARPWAKLPVTRLAAQPLHIRPRCRTQQEEFVNKKHILSASSALLAAAMLLTACSSDGGQSIDGELQVLPQHLPLPLQWLVGWCQRCWSQADKRNAVQLANRWRWASSTSFYCGGDMSILHSCQSGHAR